MPEWARKMIKRGVRPQFELENIIPGFDPEDWDSDPIIRAAELAGAGQKARARKRLERLLAKDVRCLDAHAHLGNIAFADDVRLALDHYERGVLIAALTIADSFDGVLPWGCIDNRPFHRCLHGLALCLWRLRRFEEADALLQRMLWLNPSDNLGVRFLVPKVRSRSEWTDADD